MGLNPVSGRFFYFKYLYALYQYSLTVKENIINIINCLHSSYRKNIERLRSIMHDQPQSSLDRAVWWTEHLLRHGNGRHLRAPAAFMTWTEYLDVELLIVLAFGVLSLLVAAILALTVVIKVYKYLSTSDKIKMN